MTSETQTKRRSVLLVEDNDGDAVLAEEAFNEAAIPMDVQRVANGIEALSYLRREGRYAASVRPDLIVLDLNMPRMDGREFLAHLKVDPALCAIPVVVLTTSQAERDVVESYELHANCFITKPIDFDRFCTIVERLTEFWFNVVRLPPRG